MSSEVLPDFFLTKTSGDPDGSIGDSDTLHETNSSRVRIGHPKMKFHLPTFNFRGPAVSFREGSPQGTST